ncbi:S-adenosylmethionine--2-demethylmenaquinone methyltransferase [Streptomyces luomodiensis]|uniref:Putative 4-hydroxy-4-methyl-2-oxoglutarate aldolase n=1 Tax=Streptomyces luomodiensis TaxID=3026192 RepID=A0ABY9V8I1_9ACTN|nr:S-adenosylmethionine--2-demethylmenaquinone methyltransferase [Streptomyces sp. SCA4-21]WNF01144.1 S-adenosylmethionine--2-demethylmenaquinone methyltransferase [Streptomyces sp. SCA4-21]
MTATRTATLTSATVHEAAGRIGALPSAIKPVHPAMHVEGPAFPVRMPAGDNLWLHRAVYAASPGEILVIDCGGGFEHGYFGEVLAEAALARGLAGLVIHGGVRDARRLGEIGWPVFAERVCIRGTGKDPHGDGELGEPITIGDVEIRRGDLVVADTDGVVCVPADRAEEVRAASAARDEAEHGYISRLRAGESTLAVYGLR